MLILNSPSEIKPLKLPHIVCALGVFDGVHLGHQKIIEAVVRNAKGIKGTSTIITFDNHPYTIINPSYHLPLLTSFSHKLQLLDRLSVDVCILIKFNKSVASITAENWIKEVFWRQLHIDSIYMGQDSFFGKDRGGNIDLLHQWGNRLGFRVNIIETVRINKVPVSSTLIRDSICRGDIESTKMFLGRPYSVLGTVVKGKGRGGKLGFPTANLDTENQCLPLNGVYAIWARPFEKERRIPGVANIGTRPTFTPHIQEGTVMKEQIKPTLEVYLLEETNELYNKELEVIFIKRLRDEIRFIKTPELTQQIKKDVTYAKQVLF